VPRRYEPGDAAALWELKRAFELELGAGTGGGDKRARYEAKLTPDYRDRYLDWVGRCHGDEPGCLWVADADADAGADSGATAGSDGPGEAGDLAGYAFLLPESLAMIWDAAVLNEIYVRPTARGTGLADDLLAAVVEHARGQALPLDRLVLDVDPGNGRARRFYERHGFEPWGEMVAREP
jgi:GNAT superfamily N-acetyltransferase